MSRCAVSVVCLLCCVSVCAAARAQQQIELPNRVDFLRDVMPVLGKIGCSGCHRRSPPVRGFTLSPLGSDPQADHAALVQRVSKSSPTKSLVLTRPSNRHRGCRGLQVGSPAYQILLRWIEQGAAPPHADSPHISRLFLEQSVDEPLSPGDELQLRAIADWSDGQQTDISRWAIFKSRDNEVASVADDGKVTAASSGFTIITVRCADQVTAARLLVRWPESDRQIDWPQRNVVDQRIADGWQSVQLEPAAITGDLQFCRRVYLQLIGRLPAPDELLRYLRDQQPDRRPRLIGALLRRDEYALHWAHVWADWLLADGKVNDAVYARLVRWLQISLSEDLPLNELARELLTARGQVTEQGAIGFYVAHGSPGKMVAATANALLGTRLQCAECHWHPAGVWQPDDYAAWREPFRDIWSNDQGAEAEDLLVAGPHAARQQLAITITDEQQRDLARNLVNRYWSELFGRGLVDPVNEMGPGNPATHPPLLEELANDLITHGFSGRHLLHTLVSSDVYQLSSAPNDSQPNDEWFYSRFYPQRLRNWVLHQAMRQAAGLPPDTNVRHLPWLPYYSGGGTLSRTRCPREPEPGLRSSLHLINSDYVAKLLRNPRGRIARSLAAGLSDERIIEEFYLAIMTRPPDASEWKLLKTHLKKNERRAALEDILWALVNSREFLFIH